MPLRITQNSMNRTQLAGLNNSLARLQQTQEQLTSGKKLNRPSDNPVDTVSAMRLRSEQRQLEQFGENISDGLSRLQTGDDALNRATQMVQRIRTITVAASNGTLGQSERNAYAEEVSELKNGLIQLANSQYAGRPVFAGTANVDNAFDPMSGEYQGNKLPILRVVSDAPGAAGQVNVACLGTTSFRWGAPATSRITLGGSSTVCGRTTLPKSSSNSATPTGSWTTSVRLKAPSAPEPTGFSRCRS